MGRHGYVEFEPIREPFNEYVLPDSSIVRVKYVVAKMIRDPATGGIRTNGRYVTAVYAHPSVRGPRAPSASHPAGAAKIIEEDIDFTTAKEEWNEYLLEDGSMLLAKPSLVSVSRTDAYDELGEPEYVITTAVTVKCRPPAKRA